MKKFIPNKKRKRLLPLLFGCYFTGCYRFNEKWPVTSLLNPVLGSIYSALNQ